MTRARRRLLALGLGLLIVAVLLFSLNAWAGAHGYGAGLVFDNVSVPDDVGWRWLPDQHEQSPHGFPLDINAQGLRETRDVPVPKPDGVFRILCVGDSFTFGIETPSERTYPKMLERLLAERYGEGRVEVWNAGVNGLNSCQEAAWLEHYGWELEPDLVTVGFVMNDVLPLTGSSQPRWFPGRSWMLRYPFYHWMRYHLVHRWKLGGDDPESRQLQALVRQHRGQAVKSPSASEVARRFWERALDCLRGMADRCDERAVPKVLIVFPTLGQMMAPEPLPEPQAVLAQMAGEKGYTLLDLLPDYAAVGEAALLESDKAHPNRVGHRIAAERLLATLEAAGLLPAR